MLDDLLALRAERKAKGPDIPRNEARRGFIKGLGVAAAGAAATTAFGIQHASAADLDVAILQFALNLEYLEAEFYNRAAFGNGLSSSDTGTSSNMVVGGSQVPFKSQVYAAAAREIATEELKHVRFIRAALGSSAVPEPAIDLKNSFITLGQLTGLSNNFDPFADEISFLLAAYVFEDVGVTAYHGAAALITDKNYLDKAAGILAIEAYHAGLIRMALFALGDGQQTAAISKLRTQLDGTYNKISVDDTGVGNTGNPHIAVASDFYNGTLTGGFPNSQPPGNNAIAYDRTTRQVLNIVYGDSSGSATQGLFFPSGLNGMIKS